MSKQKKRKSEGYMWVNVIGVIGDRDPVNKLFDGETALLYPTRRAALQDTDYFPAPTREQAVKVKITIERVGK